MTRDKWPPARLAYTAEQRRRIMACIQRNNVREGRALRAIPLQFPAVRDCIRRWYRERWLYLLREYEKVLPHVEELPDQ